MLDTFEEQQGGHCGWSRLACGQGEEVREVADGSLKGFHHNCLGKLLWGLKRGVS